MGRKMPAPIVLVLFDAFDTLVAPRVPPYIQYADECRKKGLSISDETMKVSFKDAFKEMTKNHPNYGLHTGLSSPNQWWELLIRLSIESAGIHHDDVMRVLPRLGPSLLHRFSSMEAYRLAEGVPEVLDQLVKIRNKGGKRSRQRLLKWNIATNSDSRILQVCQEAGLDTYFNLELSEKRGQDDFKPPRSDRSISQDRTSIPSPCLSYHLGYEKPDASFFHKAIRQSYSGRHNTEMPLSASAMMQLAAQTLYVGDHYQEDYLGAKRAGLQAVWLKRDQDWPDGVSMEDQKSINAAQSMLEVADIVRESWSKSSDESDSS